MGTWSEESLHHLPAVGEVFETNDGRHLFWLDHPDEQHVQVFWDGVGGDRLSRLVPQPNGSTFFRIPGSEHLCYYAETTDGLRVGVDDSVGRPLQGVSQSPPSVSVHGRIAYVARFDGVMRLFVDHDLDPRPVAPLKDAQAIWSPDGTRLAWVEQDASGSAARERVVVDGVEGPWTKHISTAPWGLQFSPDSSRVAYYGRSATSWQYLVDGVVGPPTEDSRAFFWSPDSRRFVYDARIRGRWHLVDDGQIGPAHDGVVLVGFDGLHRPVWISNDGKRRQIVVDGQPDPAHEGVTKPTFAPDGSRGYAIKQSPSGLIGRFRPRQRMTIDGVPCDEHVWEDISVVLFETATTPPIYRCRGGKAEHVVANGQPGPAFDLIIGPVASPEGHWAYLGLTDDGATLVVDGRNLAPAGDLVTVEMDQVLLFMPDGAGVAWALQLDEGWHPAVGDDIGPACQRVLPPHIDADGGAFWHAIRNDFVTRISYRD